jgi:hypothetical protein
MSGEFALALTLLTLGSCYASWRLGIARGQQEMINKYRHLEEDCE